MLCRKAVANTKAVDERQQLQTIQREEKTSARSMGALQEAHSSLETRKNELETEAATLNERKEEVETKEQTLQADLAKAKQEVVNQQTEYARVRLVTIYLTGSSSDAFIANSRRSSMRNSMKLMRNSYRRVLIEENQNVTPR